MPEQQWQYRTITAKFGGKPWTWRAHSANGQLVAEFPQSMSLFELMDLLGAEGWELVQFQVMPSMSNDESMYVMFKRPR